MEKKKSFFLKDKLHKILAVSYTVVTVSNKKNPLLSLQPNKKFKEK